MKTFDEVMELKKQNDKLKVALLEAAERTMYPPVILTDNASQKVIEAHQKYRKIFGRFYYYVGVPR